MSFPCRTDERTGWPGLHLLCSSVVRQVFHEAHSKKYHQERMSLESGLHLGTALGLCSIGHCSGQLRTFSWRIYRQRPCDVDLGQDSILNQAPSLPVLHQGFADIHVDAMESEEKAMTLCMGDNRMAMLCRAALMLVEDKWNARQAHN